MNAATSRPDYRAKVSPRFVVLVFLLSLVAGACNSSAREGAGDREGTGDVEVGPTLDAGASETAREADAGTDPRVPNRTATQGGSEQPALAEAPAQPGQPAQPGAPAQQEGPAEPGAPAAPAQPAQLGTGVSENEIVVGFSYYEDMDTGAALLGGNLEDPSRDQIEAFIAAYNNRGGLGGRQIKPVFYADRITGNKTMAQRDQELCATFTEDNQVFATGPVTAFPGPAVLECLRNAKTQYVQIGMIHAMHTWDDEAFAAFPGLWNIMGASADRFATSLIDFLDNEGWLERGPTVKYGLVGQNHVSYVRAFERSLVPAMAERGLEFERVLLYDPVDTLNGLTAAQSRSQSEVVRFRSAGITHVISLFDSGAAFGTFVGAAERQGYRPKYGLTTNSYNPTHDSWTQQDIRNSLSGAISMGYGDFMDTRYVYGGDARVPVTPGMEECMSLAREGGYNGPTTFNFYKYCDYLKFLAVGLERAAAPTYEGFIEAMETAGPLEFAINGAANPVQFGPGRHGGASVYRATRWDDQCWANRERENCWTYTGQPTNF